jgi:broad-specificity NMP kinase
MKDVLESLNVTGVTGGKNAQRKNNWVRDGVYFYVRNGSETVRYLNNGVYHVKRDSQSGELFLQFLKESFEFPFPVYDLEEQFVERVATTYSHTHGNLGILLNGIKGTGKSVTAEKICNKLGLPVVIVGHDYPNLAEFISEFEQDAVFFFDEYEKVFKNKGYEKNTTLLSIMDGAMNSTARRVFLLTTNELHVDDNLLARPGRIRYLKTFGNLSAETVAKIVDSKLQGDRKHWRDSLLCSISELELVTVDIVSALTLEVNIHDEEPRSFLAYFNVKKNDVKKDIYEVIEQTNGTRIEREWGKGVVLSHKSFSSEDINDRVEFDGRVMGYLHEITQEGNLVIREEKEEKHSYSTYRLVPAIVQRKDIVDLCQGKSQV